MKTRKLNKREKWKLCQAILSMCKDYEIVGSKSSEQHDSYEALARKIIAKYPEISADMLQPVKDWDIQLRFVIGRKKIESWTEQESNNFWMLGSIIQALENVLKNHKPVIIDYEKPRRMASPPFEAYYQVGHSALNVGAGRISDNQMRQRKRPYR